VSKLVQ